MKFSVAVIATVISVASISVNFVFSIPLPSKMKRIGSINVDGFGIVDVVTQTPGNVILSNNGFTLRGGGRVYFAVGNSYWQTQLLGKRFAYQVDVSNVGCHCNAAAYFVQMPGFNSRQGPEPGPDGSYYCDANFGNSNFCPEYDAFEGNKHTMVSTLHTCTYVPPSFYSNCDRGGCATNAFNVNRNLMCPENRCIINTNRPYTVSHAQAKGRDGNMNNVNVWFGQEGRSANFNVCGKDNVKWMGFSLNGIVFVASLWGGPGLDMTWMDGMTGCQGQCNLGASSVTFRNFELKNL